MQILREELLKSLQSFVQMAADEPLPDRCAVDASALLRLYCALKVKFEKFNSLIRLILIPKISDFVGHSRDEIV